MSGDSELSKQVQALSQRLTILEHFTAHNLLQQSATSAHIAGTTHSLFAALLAMLETHPDPGKLWAAMQAKLDVVAGTALNEPSEPQVQSVLQTQDFIERALRRAGAQEIV